MLVIKWLSCNPKFDVLTSPERNVTIAAAISFSKVGGFPMDHEQRYCENIQEQQMRNSRRSTAWRKKIKVLKVDLNEISFRNIVQQFSKSFPAMD